MDCAPEACIPVRGPSLTRARSPSIGNCGGACESAHSSTSNSGGGAAAIPLLADELAALSRHKLPPHQAHETQQQQQQQNCNSNSSAHFSKVLSFSTLGGSASNLSALGQTTTTNTGGSVTGSSEHSTPVSGSSSHRLIQQQQQQLRARAQRLADESNPNRASLDSRSSSHTREHDSHTNHHEEEQQDEEDVHHLSQNLAPQPPRVSPASSAVRHAITTHSHFSARSTPSSKRPRPLAPESTTRTPQQQEDADKARAGMHIPDLATFGNASSAQRASPMTTSNIAAHDHGSRNNSNDNTVLRVHDAVEYEDEIAQAVQHAAVKRPTERDDDSGAESKHAKQNSTSPSSFRVPSMPAGSHSVTHAVAPDATPQEPPPKRFATSEYGETQEDLSELEYATGVSGREEALKEVRRRPASAEDEDAEAAEKRASMLPQQQVKEEEDEQQPRPQPDDLSSTHKSKATAAGEEANVDDDEQMPPSRPPALAVEKTKSSAGSSRRNTTAAIATSAGTPSQAHQREGGRRKSRLLNGSGGTGSLLGGLRFNNDSVTANIPYDPTHFHTPVMQQQHQHTDREDEESVMKATHKGEARSALPRERSVSQPSCATPPESREARPAEGGSNTELKTSSTDAAAAAAVAPLAAPRLTIKLTETRYAFLALSFMMRMLCKLHKGEPIPSSDFHSHCIPPMSVTMYVQRLVRYCACSGEALLCAFLLLLKYAFHSGHPITIYNAHRLLITSIVLGIKLRDDVYYSNVYYGRIGGISGREMNKLEVLFLGKLDWETQVHDDEYTALLDLLETVGTNTDPTEAQLVAFAGAYPEKVAAYVPDEDDEELEEAAVKGASASATTTASAAAAMSTAPAAVAPVMMSIAARDAENDKEASTQQVSRKALRGAYRLHQWHTLVEPWMAQLQQHVFAKREENAKVSAAVWREEGERWNQYYRDDDEAAARLQRETSASAWLSPISVQPPCNSGSSSNKNTQGSALAAAASAWSTEPPYQSAWAPTDTYNGSNNAYGTFTSTNTSNANGNQQNPRYNNFINFANVVTSGYFGATGVTTANTASSSNAAAAAGSSLSGKHPSPASSSQHRHASGSNGAPHRGHSSHGGSSSTGSASNAVRYHTALDRPPRATFATFGITNRAAAGSSLGSNLQEGGPLTEGHARHGTNNNNASLASFSSAFESQQPSVADTAAAAARLTSPNSFVTPGSGINVNAQPYYYVSSRVRKQQQQQQQASSAVTASIDPSPPTLTDVTEATVAVHGPTGTSSTSGNQLTTTDNEATDARSASSSFTSPTSVNPPSRHSGFADIATSNSNKGLEMVLSAMKKSGTTTTTTTALFEADGGHNTTGKAASHADVLDVSDQSASGNLTFPARPIRKGPAGNSLESDRVTAPRVPRRSPATSSNQAGTAAMHRRATMPSQHALGKKRSKPDSYKDY